MTRLWGHGGMQHLITYKQNISQLRVMFGVLVLYIGDPKRSTVPRKEQTKTRTQTSGLD